jgi:large subunit ribosomal protein L6
VPDGVKVEHHAPLIKVSGPKGTLEENFQERVTIQIDGNEIRIARASDRKEDRAYHGLTRALINNMVTGVSQGFEKVLLIEGVGYRASLQGTTLNLALGYSHPVSMEPPAGITFVVEGTQTIKVSGIDKQLVGQVAANIRALRKPEPYKGKGIRYSTERIRRKVGKAGGK